MFMLLIKKWNLEQSNFYFILFLLSFTYIWIIFSVPREALTEFLENQILSKYTFLFDQKVENMGPDGTTEIQPWIKKILSEMQSSIEEHISAAMRSNG